MVEEVKVELQQIKSEIQKPMFEEEKGDENNVVFEKTEENQNPMKLLGELLAFLRKERSMSLLMLCRQIDKIEIDGKTAVIFSNDDDMMSIQTNDRFRTDISRFFESKGLGFKVKEKEVKFSEVDELQRLLGKKLKIK